MPAIMEAKCDQCSYMVRCSQSASFVVLDDGKEEVLGHPLEATIAKRLTGKSLSELRKEGRLRYKYSLICPACGKCNYYTKPGADKKGHIGAIVDCIEPVMANEITCLRCGQEGLQSVMGEQISCLSVLWDKRPQPNTFDCPKCKQGTVTITMIGKS